ncbi:MAG: carboxypeptidase-like regulatory domain-containing protein [Thermoplasmata archaeon]|nr:carboxypeptidase-like regulatory domain-containing protein [Thermoplasmata archaeon]
MSGPLVSVRCPTCGGPVSVYVAPAPPTQWFACPHCRTPVPVVVPRDPPPLYTWEVLPGLYPSLPAPRAPRWRASRAAAGALLNVAVIAAVLAAVLGYYAVVADTPGSFSVSGNVGLYQSLSGEIVPAAGALVVATDEAGHNFTTSTGIDGSFEVAGLPTGGVSLNFTFPNYAPVTEEVFLSTVFSSGASSVSVVLVPGGASNSSASSLTPFANVETFVAAIGGAVVLLGLIAVVAAASAILTYRSDRPALGVVGGGAGLLSPLAIVFLGLGSAFPVVLAVTAVLAAIGGFALAIRTLDIALVGSAPD